ncbi:MAG: hypothetical protein MR825_03600 [Lawsonibacter sp.]|nr:hypothetical protein [Lawsonibacter sp.]
MFADLCCGGGTGSRIKTAQVPAGKFCSYAGHIGVPPQTVLDRRQNDMSQPSI